MGTWGAGIFSDDIALDAREDWLDLVRSGVAPEDAERRLANGFSDDAQARDVTILALAAVAWRHGRLSESLRVRALEVIESGRDTDRWRADSPELLPRRQRTLRLLAERLVRGQPSATVLRPRALHRPEFPAGTLLSIQLLKERVAICRVRHRAVREGTYCQYELLRWDQARLPTVDELGSAETLSIPTVPSRYRDQDGRTRFSQGTAPHRCAVSWRRAERKDPRVRVLGAGPDPGPLAREASHGHFGLDSWIRHLDEVYRTGTWSWMTPWVSDATPEPD